MKKLIFVTQSKGGAGKSVLTFLLAEFYPAASVLDMDDATKTTTLQLAYRKPIPISFLDSNNVIDRGLFNAFLEKISQSKNDLFLCDLGASISEQLPYYLKDVSEFLAGALKQLDIELEMWNVVGGANIFTQTMEYLEALRKSAGPHFKIKVCKNEYYDFTVDQSAQLDKYVAKHDLALIPFNITQDKNESTQNRVKEVLKSGTGLENAPVFSKMYFQNAIKNLEKHLNTEKEEQTLEG